MEKHSGTCQPLLHCCLLGAWKIILRNHAVTKVLWKNAVCTYKPLRKVKESYQQKNPHSKIISKLLKKVDRVTALFLDQQMIPEIQKL
jgi:hypothetical protein